MKRENQLGNSFVPQCSSIQLELELWSDSVDININKLVEEDAYEALRKITSEE
ncbi:hypothetical protein [Psychromonas algicola]|uniref:hypothetical protein n=1 Tax=Psychromonas algicola TaxID=2555642 RepID=UPI0014192C96|nr:hypothetical protein [Psychromonas sp. RZ5]